MYNMALLTKDDLLSRRDFEANRNALREQLQAVLQKRRYILGPSLILSFFNKDIVKYRLEQIVWAEKISDEQLLKDYLNSFNNFIPGDFELVAEILLKFDEKTEIQTILEQFKNLENSQSIFLTSDSHDNVYPEYFQSNDSTGHHCVYYTRFKLDEKQVKVLKDSKLSLVINKESYNYQVKLDQALL